ncbi:MAG: hypothetical protein HDR88_04950 [Bacteroides sp.]|nr:hypothetical protein [Bacteroides sp.]
MKKIFTLALAIAAALPVFADINTINYQALINDKEGKPVTQKNIGLKFTILNGEGVVYSETASVTSTAKGMVSWEIGSTEGGLPYINWGNGNYTLEVAIDLKGGQDYSSVYTSTIQSVPTALYSVNGNEAMNLAEYAVDQAEIARHQADYAEGLADYAMDRADEVYADLETQVDRIDGSIADLKGSIADLQALDTEYKDIKDDVTDIRAILDVLRTQI